MLVSHAATRADVRAQVLVSAVVAHTFNLRPWASAPWQRAYAADTRPGGVSNPT
jgi:hypothetical protein